MSTHGAIFEIMFFRFEQEKQKIGAKNRRMRYLIAMRK
jgi:hypothetical protein